jgi:hypothetical protein
MSENYCIVCGEDVGNNVFSVCDDCWDKETKEYIYIINDIEILELIQHKTGYDKKITKVMVKYSRH